MSIYDHHEMEPEKPQRKHFCYLISCKEEEALVLVVLQYFILLPRKLQLTLLAFLL